jgi:hypothetical protein
MTFHDEISAQAHLADRLTLLSGLAGAPHLGPWPAQPTGRLLLSPPSVIHAHHRTVRRWVGLQFVHVGSRFVASIASLNGVPFGTGLADVGGQRRRAWGQRSRLTRLALGRPVSGMRHMQTETDAGAVVQGQRGSLHQPPERDIGQDEQGFTAADLSVQSLAPRFLSSE